MRAILGAIGRYVRLDWPIAIFAAVFLALFAPLVPRNTDNPQLLAAYSNDEPFLAMALEATLVPPYGNPGVYFDQTKAAASDIPDRWGDKRYFNITYYGGALFQLTFPVYAVLRVVGLPPFPTGPIILRVVTLFAGLLSLVVLYNIGRERGSRLAGLLASVVVVSDVSFLYYANFVHPDTLQMLFGLGVLLVATAHARSGSMVTLVALGVLCGVVQGTKSGGPWTVPVALLAAAIGVKACASPSSMGWPMTKRAALLGPAALAGFFVTTPYAFLDTYYARSLRLQYDIVSTNSLQQDLSPFSWSSAVYDHIGPIGAVLILLTFGRATWSWAHKRQDHMLALAVVLVLSQFLWYGVAGRLWHVVGYLILSFGLVALFAFETLLLGIQTLIARSSTLSDSIRAGRFVRAAAVSVLCAAVAASCWYPPVDYALDQHASSRSSVRDANDWAVEHDVPQDAVIVVDDLAYLDLEQFPNAQLHGGVLTWSDVERRRPDFIVLSSSLFGADWMQRLIARQRLERDDPNPFNVRVYQELLPTTSPGPTQVPGIVLAGVLRPTDPTSNCSGLADCAEDVERRLRSLAPGDDRSLVGPEIRIYRVDPAFGPSGQSRP